MAKQIAQAPAEKIKKANSKRLGKRKDIHWQLWLMMIPAIVYMLLFVYKPMGGVLIAFQDYSLKRGIWGSEWVGFENFNRLFKSYWFPIILKNTLTLSLLSLILSFPAPIILALAANEIRSERRKRTFQTVSYAPHFISTVVVCGMITVFLSPESGVINFLLQAIGIDPVAFLAKPNAFKWVYVLSGIWQTVGWSAIIYIAALSGVDKNLLEAAEIDGANRIQRIRYVNLPVLVPTIVIMFILRCGSILSVGYEKVYLLQNTANLSASEVISTYVYKVGLEKADFGFSTAVNLFNNVINCIVLILSNKISKKVSGSSLF
jgi:putative aldouronate transport system permease protein